MKQMQIHNSTDIVADIKQIIEQARKQAYTSINSLMIQSNWLVGRRIVEEEQGGASRAEYGKALLKNLATELIPIYAIHILLAVCRIIVNSISISGI